MGKGERKDEKVRIARELDDIGIQRIEAGFPIVSVVLSIKEKDFILAARSVGVRESRIMQRHVTPNCMAAYW